MTGRRSSSAWRERPDTMKVLSIVGARPQFVKAAAVSRCLRPRCTEILVHTGQHYDENMSDVFFRELEIPEPDHHLGVGSGSHGVQTGAMLSGLERVMMDETPDRVLIYGDTNSTLAGALAAAKLHIPVAHVEAGLRSFNRRMPEEINRVVADHLSTLLLCPSETAVANLAAEGVVRGVHSVGDVMAEALAHAVALARARSRILERLGLESGRFLLATIHRAENVDAPDRLRDLIRALVDLDEVVIFPVHPRTRKALEHLQDVRLEGSRVRCVDPVGYLDMVQLESSARRILTDSGGVQKEAYWLNIPCITLREETEWVETVGAGWNRLVGADPERIRAAVRQWTPPVERPELYGDGHAAERCVELLVRP